MHRGYHLLAGGEQEIRMSSRNAHNLWVGEFAPDSLNRRRSKWSPVFLVPGEVPGRRAESPLCESKKVSPKIASVGEMDLGVVARVAKIKDTERLFAIFLPPLAPERLLFPI